MPKLVGIAEAVGEAVAADFFAVMLLWILKKCFAELQILHAGFVAPAASVGTGAASSAARRRASIVTTDRRIVCAFFLGFRGDSVLRPTVGGHLRSGGAPPSGVLRAQVLT